jgi:hypothetical protein
MQYSAIQCNAVQYNAIQCNTMQYNAIQCNKVNQMGLLKGISYKNIVNESHNKNSIEI